MSLNVEALNNKSVDILAAVATMKQSECIILSESILFLNYRERWAVAWPRTGHRLHWSQGIAKRQAASYSHIHGWFRTGNGPNIHVFGLHEEAGASYCEAAVLTTAALFICEAALKWLRMSRKGACCPLWANRGIARQQNKIKAFLELSKFGQTGSLSHPPFNMKLCFVFIEFWFTFIY